MNVTYNVDSECSVSKEPGATVVIWLSYSESRRTELRPVKLSFPTQLTRLLLSILRKEVLTFLSLAQAGAAADGVAWARVKRYDSKGLLLVEELQVQGPLCHPSPHLKGLSAVWMETIGNQKGEWVGFTEAWGVSPKNFCFFFSFNTRISNYELVNW